MRDNKMFMTYQKQQKRQIRQTILLSLVGMIFSLSQTLWLYKNIKKYR
jgi:hypothetical protein